MYKHASIPAVLEKLARRTMVAPAGRHSAIHSDFNIDFSNWNWHQGVALYGLWQAGQSVGGGSCQRFIEDWVAGKIAEGVPPP
ncbi:MAG: hypothetical protein LBM92_08615, partial [Opitutaceae bacterium]|nr:hypothetical protein [Opitutaceae bacterium]